MRFVAVLTLLLALSLVSIAAAPVRAQEALELPTYAPGDFWEYEVEVAEVSSLDEDLTFDVTADVTLRVTVEERTEVTIEGVTHEAYQMAGVLSVEVESSDLSGTSVSGTIVVNYTSYVAVEGLETLKVEALFGGTVTTVVEGFTVTIPLTGSLNATFVYSEDTWSFPLEEGKTGQEAFNVTGDFHAQLGNLTPFESDFSTPAALQREVEGRQSVSVPAGTFDTWVVRTAVTADTAGSGESESPPQREYWAEAAGAPVQYISYDDQGAEVAWVNLTSFGGAGLTILGVDAIIFIPSLAAVAVAVVVAYFVLRRRRPPQPKMMEPAAPLGPPEAPETAPPPAEEGEL